jgi:GNAT superfamily N-acetyltransferase
MNITIERATSTDAETLVRVQIAAFHHDSILYPGIEPGGPPGYDSVPATLKKIEHEDYYKILDGRQCIGGIVVHDLGLDHYHLDLLYLDPAYHNQGIGKQAMQFIEQEYPARIWTLNTPVYAVRNQYFYEKLGYVKVGEHDEEGGIPLFDYEKQITEQE